VAAGEFGSLQEAEFSKYLKRRDELQPKINVFLKDGYSVELTLIVEKPDRPDLLCRAGAFCDQGQFIYFYDLFISYVISNKPITRRSPQPPNSMSPGGPPSFKPLPYQGGSFTGGGPFGEKEIEHLPARRSAYHLEYGKEVVLPLASTEREQPGGQAGEEIGQVQDVLGTYSLKFEKQFSGPSHSIVSMMTRRLRIEQNPSGELLPKMWDLSEAYFYEPYTVHKPAVLSGRFSRGKSFPEKFQSVLVYHPREKILLEWVKGLDSGLSIVSDALFSWRKV
jgi:hypothetical protein